jgi:peptidoglycan/LPS O-acetylase OafA/YrhL
MGLLAAAVLVFQFVLHQFTEFGVSVLRSTRLGVFRVFFAALLLHALFSPATSLAGRFFRSGPMRSLGKYSYGLYVYHHFFSYYFVTHGTEFALANVLGSHTVAVAVQAVGGMAASVAIAWVSYEFFEKHFLRLKRFWPSSSSPPAARRGLAVASAGHRRSGP